MSKENLFPALLSSGWASTVFVPIRRSTRHWLVGMLLCVWSVVVATAAPTVTVISPRKNVLAPGQSLNLSVTAAGSGAVTYQWLRKGKAIVGATGATLVISGATYADSGWYSLDATDGGGTTRSAPFFVSVAPVRTQLRSWGDNSVGQTATPVGLTDIIAVSAGNAHTLALKRDGTVSAWGNDSAGQTDVPAGLANVVAVAAGGNHSFVLKSDGAVLGWGGLTNSLEANVPAGLSGVVSIATFQEYSLAIKNDGTVVALGDPAANQANLPAGLTDVVAVSPGSPQALALKRDGTLVGWGSGYYGSMDLPAGLNNVRAIVGGGYYSNALKNDGSVTGWAKAIGNDHGEINIPAGLNNVTAIAGGYYHMIALRSDDTMVSWGDNSAGQTTIPQGINHVLSVSAGGTFSYALRDASNDTVPSIVTQPMGLTVPESEKAILSVTVTGNGPFTYQWRRNGVNLSGATSATLVLDETLLSDAGSYDVVVTNHIGSVTSKSVTLVVKPVPVISNQSAPRAVINPGAALQLGVNASGIGTLSYKWIHNGRVVAGATTNTFSVPNAATGDGGWYRVLITDANGTRRSALMFVMVAPVVTEVKIFGETTSGSGAIPVGLSDAVSVCLSGNPARVFAIKRDGTVVSWGDAAVGAFSVPAGLANIVSLAAANDYVLALKSDGTVSGWGTDSQLANIPSGLKDVVAISARGHALALKSNGTVVSWGVNTNGSTSVPVDLVDVMAVSAGSGHSLALKQDGTVVAWGYNYYGETTVPADLVDAIAISAGDYHSIALKSDATVVSWGGFYVNPIPPGMVNIDAISAGFTHSLVLFGDGTVNIWGKDGTLNPMVPQPGLGGVLSIASGGNTAAAIIDPARNTAPVITVQPLARTILENEPVDFVVKLYGSAPFTYQWRRNGISVPGATSSGLHISAVKPSDVGAYDVVITNSKSSVTSTAAALGMLPLPVITARSSGRQVLVPGEQMDLSVSATGTGPLTYQWMHNNRIIAGATGASFSVATSSMQDSGWYVVLIGDNYGVRRSAPFFVIVAPEVTRVRAWGGGSFSYGGDQVPSGLTNVVKIAAGPGHSLALKADGTVVAWGDNTDGESIVPAGLTEIVDLVGCYGTGGYGCSVALKSNGTVVQWGQGGALPAGLTDVVSIAAGLNHVLALKSDGTVVNWANGSGYSSSTIPPAGLKNVVAIAGGYNRSIALKDDGTVVTWGVVYSDETSMPSGLGSVIAVASGNRHSLALKSDGSVVAWGYNSGGQLNVPPSLTNVAAISASAFYSLALKTDGTVVEWGNSGQTTPPADLDNVMAISAGYNFSLALQAAPIFTSQPGDVEVSQNQTASFVAPLLRGGSSHFQWQKNGLDIPGANGSSYVIAQVNRNDSGNYRVVATNSVGSTISHFALLTVKFPPEITTQPLAQYYAAVGAAVTFSVSVTGYPEPIFQWRKNGVNISSANGSSYSITNVSAGDAGSYSVHATNTIGSATSTDALLVIVPYTAPTIKTLGDFDGDGKADLFWSNAVTGERSMWFLNGNTTSGGASLGMVPAVWLVSATADFDGDGKADIFWTNPLTGDRAMWLMSGSTMRTNTFMGTVSPDWIISGTGDFNGDGKADLVWTKTTTGDRAMWLMNGSTVLGGGYLGTVPVEWVISGVGDFNGDGKADLVWSNMATGERSMWFQNGNSTIGGAAVNTVPVAWVINGVGDFNGDGKADILLTNTVSGDRVIWLMNGSTIQTNAFMGTVPVEWAISGTGDFNGDGKKDLFWTNTATGDRAMWLLNGSTVTGGGYMGTVPVVWKINN